MVVVFGVELEDTPPPRRTRSAKSEWSNLDMPIMTLGSMCRHSCRNSAVMSAELLHHPALTFQLLGGQGGLKELKPLLAARVFAGENVLKHG